MRRDLRSSASWRASTGIGTAKPENGKGVALARGSQYGNAAVVVAKGRWDWKSHPAVASPFYKSTCARM